MLNDSRDRLSVVEYGLLLARVVALRGTCRRRTVGCVLMDNRNHIVATGYNGNPAGAPHCIDVPCAGYKDAHGDTRRCMALHAEYNAVNQAGSHREFITQAFCTDSPCIDCARLLRLQLPNLKRIYFVRKYTDEGLDYLNKNGIETIAYEHFYNNSLDAIILIHERDGVVRDPDGKWRERIPQ